MLGSQSERSIRAFPPWLSAVSHLRLPLPVGCFGFDRFRPVGKLFLFGSDGMKLVRFGPFHRLFPAFARKPGFPDPFHDIQHGGRRSRPVQRGFEVTKAAAGGRRRLSGSTLWIPVRRGRQAQAIRSAFRSRTHAQYPYPERTPEGNGRKTYGHRRKQTNRTRRSFNGPSTTRSHSEPMDAGAIRGSKY